MKGKKLSEFIESLYHNPEMEIEYMDKRYMVSGYLEQEEYTLCVDTIEQASETVFISQNRERQKCVEEFETARIFAGRTIYEAEAEITVLYG